MVEFREDDLPFTPQHLFQGMVEESCLAVAGYIGETWGWQLVMKVGMGREAHGPEYERMRRAWAALPGPSRDILIAEAKRSGYSGTPMNRLLPLVWLSKKQLKARQESIVSIAMRCVSHDEWLKR